MPGTDTNDSLTVAGYAVLKHWSRCCASAATT